MHASFLMDLLFSLIISSTVPYRISQDFFFLFELQFYLVRKRNDTFLSKMTRGADMLTFPPLCTQHDLFPSARSLSSQRGCTSPAAFPVWEAQREVAVRAKILLIHLAKLSTQLQCSLPAVSPAGPAVNFYLIKIFSLVLYQVIKKTGFFFLWFTPLCFTITGANYIQRCPVNNCVTSKE